jgi:hypothetical protein
VESHSRSKKFESPEAIFNFSSWDTKHVRGCGSIPKTNFGGKCGGSSHLIVRHGRCQDMQRCYKLHQPHFTFPSAASSSLMKLGVMLGIPQPTIRLGRAYSGQLILDYSINISKRCLSTNVCIITI